MNSDQKKTLIWAGIMGAVTTGLTLLAANPKARTAVKNCGLKLMESGGSILQKAQDQGSDLVEIAKGQAVLALGVAQEKLGSLKEGLEPKPEKTE